MSFYRRLPTSYMFSGTSGGTQPTIYITDGGGSTSTGSTGTVTTASNAFTELDQNENTGEVVLTRYSGGQKTWIPKRVVSNIAWNTLQQRMEIRYLDATENLNVPLPFLGSGYNQASLDADGKLVLTPTTGTPTILNITARSVSGITAPNAKSIGITYGTGTDATTTYISNPLRTAIAGVDFAASRGNLILTTAEGNQSEVSLPFANTIKTASFNTTTRKIDLVLANNTPTELALDFANSVSNIQLVGSDIRYFWANGNNTSFTIPLTAGAFTDASAVSNGITFTTTTGPKSLTLPSANSIIGATASSTGIVFAHAYNNGLTSVVLPSANAVTSASILPRSANLRLGYAIGSSTANVTLPNSVTGLFLTGDRNLGVTYVEGNATSTFPLDFANSFSSVSVNTTSQQLQFQRANLTGWANIDLPSANAFIGASHNVSTGNLYFVRGGNGLPTKIDLPVPVVSGELDTDRAIVLRLANNMPVKITNSNVFANAVSNFGILSNTGGNYYKIDYANATRTDFIRPPWSNAVTAVDRLPNGSLSVSWANSATPGIIPLPIGITGWEFLPSRQLQLKLSGEPYLMNITLDFANAVSNISLNGNNTTLLIEKANKDWSNIFMPFANAFTSVASNGMTLTLSNSGGATTNVNLPTDIISTLQIEDTGLRWGAKNTANGVLQYPFSTLLTGVSADTTNSNVVFTRYNAAPVLINLRQWSNGFTGASLTAGRSLRFVDAFNTPTDIPINFANSVSSLRVNGNNVEVAYANANTTFFPIALPNRVANVLRVGTDIHVTYPNMDKDIIPINTTTGLTAASFAAGNSNRLVLTRDAGDLNVYVPSGNAFVGAQFNGNAGQGRNLMFTTANGQTVITDLGSFANAFVTATLVDTNLTLTRANGDPVPLSLTDAIKSISYNPTANRAQLTVRTINNVAKDVDISSFSNPVVSFSSAPSYFEVKRAGDAVGIATYLPATSNCNVFTVGHTVNFGGQTGTLDYTMSANRADTNFVLATGTGTPLVTVTSSGAVTAAGGFTGSGSGLTSLNATNLSTGTLNVARLPDSTATSGTYGSLSRIPQLAIDGKGRVTAISNIDISAFSNPVVSFSSAPSYFEVRRANDATGSALYLPATSNCNVFSIAHSLRFGGSGGTVNYVMSAALDSGFALTSGNGTPLMLVNTAGDLRMVGDVVAKDVITLSDARYKTDQQLVTGALDKIQQLRGMTFTMDGQRKAGVIAQDVETVLPEAVEKLEDGKLAVMYNALSALYIEAIKELRERVDGLTAYINSTSSRLSV